MKRKIIDSILPVLFLPLFALFSFSKGNEGNYQVVIQEFDSPPKIDGILENPLWLRGAVLETFTQYEPQEGASPSEKTIAYLGYDKDNLYIGLRCFDSNPKAIRACLTQRDKVFGDDEVTIYLDTFNDQKRAFVFQVNPCGIQSDGIYTEPTGRRGGRGGGGMGFERVDYNWDTFFNSDARIDGQGYTVEMSIPFKSLRFPNTPTQVWGLQMMRQIRRKNEEIYWFPRTRDVNGFLVQSGKIEIKGPIEKGKNVEIMPVMTGIKQTAEKFNPEGGINLKYGIASDMTSDLTFNPDFSQIEADIPQVEVNKRYAVYYPEKRPFFLEGKDFFDTPLELVYARKIIDPQLGLKLTGKIGKTTLGFLSAIDENPPEIIIGEDSSDDEEEDEGPPGRAIVNVFRLKRDLFQESHIGLIITDKERGSSLNSLFQDYNRVAGIDGHFKFLDNNRFSFQILSAVTKAGAEKTDFVPAMSFSLNHVSRHLNISADWTSIHPDFEASTGFFRRKDIHSFHSRTSYSFLPQTDMLISVTPSLEYRRMYDFNQTLTDEEYTVSMFISGWRQSHFWGSFSSFFERYNGVNFRGKEFRGNLSSEPFSWLSGNISYSFGDGIYYDVEPYQGYKTSMGARITLKPLSNLRFYYDFQNNEFYRKKGGEKVYEINLISQRISYQISRALSLRLVTDYNDYDKKFYASFLFSYEYRPGTVFYFGIDDNMIKGQSGVFRSEGRYYFIKFSYWWRI